MKNNSLISLAATTLLLVVSGGLYGFGYYVLTSSTAKSANLQTQIDAKTVELDRATRAHVELTTLTADEDALNQYSIQKSDVVPFLETLQSTGKPLGSVVKVLSVGDQNTDGHSRILLSLSISGSFDSVMRTLGAIEYGPYDGVVSSVALDTAKLPTGNVWTAAVLYSVGVQSATSTKP